MKHLSKFEVIKEKQILLFINLGVLISANSNFHTCALCEVAWLEHKD